MNSFQIAIAEENHNKIRQLKKDLKVWEQEFAKIHGVKPTKADIALVPEVEIRYRAYAKLKKLENDANKEKESKQLNLSSSQTLSDHQSPTKKDQPSPIDNSPIRLSPSNHEFKSPTLVDSLPIANSIIEQKSKPNSESKSPSIDDVVPISQPRPLTAKQDISEFAMRPPSQPRPPTAKKITPEDVLSQPRPPTAKKATPEDVLSQPRPPTAKKQIEAGPVPPSQPRPRTAKQMENAENDDSQSRPRTAKQTVNILEGPIAKQDLGNSENKFMLLLAEQRKIAAMNQEAAENEALNIKTYQKVNEVNIEENLADAEAIKDFNERKNEIDNLTSKQQELIADEIDNDGNNIDIIVSDDYKEVKEPVVIQLREIPSNSSLNMKRAKSSNSISPILPQEDEHQDLESEMYTAELSEYLKGEIGDEQSSIISEKILPPPIDTKLETIKPSKPPNFDPSLNVKNLPSLLVDDVFRYVSSNFSGDADHLVYYDVDLLGKRVYLVKRSQHTTFTTKPIMHSYFVPKRSFCRKKSIL